MGGATTIAGNVIGGRSALDNIGRGIVTGGITGGLAPGLSEVSGLGIPASAGLIQGGLTTLATGSLSRGLMAGMGAYGMYGLGESVANAGASSLTESYLGDYQSALAERGIQTGSPEYGEAARKMVTDARASIPIGDKMSAGFDAVKANPFGFAKNNLGYLAAAASPILADAMVPTTTKMPEATDTGYIRQKVYDPGTQTYRSLTPVKANEWKDRNFSDIYRGYNGGGIVALAAGGTGQTVADLYASVGRTPDAEGQAFWESAFGKGPVTADQAASFMQSANAVKAQEAAAAPAAVVAPTTIATPIGASLDNTPPQPIVDTFPNNTGITALQPQAISSQPSVLPPPTGGTSVADAQTAVNNIYRNVLGRDADATGLNFWSNAIAGGRSVDSVYQDILKSANTIKSAGTLGDFGIKALSTADATKPYAGFTSTEGNTIADEWVRNTLNREPTDADRTQSWYKDVANLGTGADATKVYGDFSKYATTETNAEIASRIAAIDAELKAKGLTDADLLSQTGKTKQQLAAEGFKTGLGFMGASQLAPAGDRTTFDLKAALKKLTPITNTSDGSVVARTITNPAGNAINPGDLTRNVDGTTTVTPNIPYRPYGGFPGMASVRNAYTQGGGSLGYTSPVVTSAEEHEARYNKQTDDSKAAYDYLMGKGKYPTKSKVGEIAQPYREATMGYPTSTNKAYNYDATTGKMVRNPDYVAPIRDAAGNVNYSMSLNEMKKYLTANPLSGQALYDWAQSNGASAQDVADATGRKLSDVYAEFRDGAKKAATAKKIGTAATDTGTDLNVNLAGGGMSYSVGGGLGSLGSYSDGGRLLKGPGDGVSDSIPATIGQKQQPARLADGEFVVPARIVSELGNGSTDAGAKKLYAMLDRVQRARGKTTGKNKVAANSRAEKYLPA